MGVTERTVIEVRCHCERCGGEWTARNGIPPRICRFCKSSKWKLVLKPGERPNTRRVKPAIPA